MNKNYIYLSIFLMLTCNASEENESFQSLSGDQTNSDLENDYDDDYIVNFDNISPDSSDYNLSDSESESSESLVSSESESIESNSSYREFDWSDSDISSVSSFEYERPRSQSAPPVLCPLETKKEEQI